jgi:glycosyltransferase involved in cell wall biosynthesis
MSRNNKKQSLGRILMLVENHYPSDSRVRNEATLLHSAGYDVTVISQRSGNEPRHEVIGGVRVYRVPRIELFKKTIAESPGILSSALLKLKTFCGYGVEYLYFTSACLLMSIYIFLRHGFDAIHAHNPPDTLFMVALPFKLLGKRFVFDHHDLCPELYQSRYGGGECIQTRLLHIVEQCTLRLADVTIATNESYKKIQIERGGRDPRSIFVVRNGPNASKMIARPEPAARLRNLNKCILVYIGSLNPQDGVDYLLRSLHYLLYELKRDDFHCVIMGSGDSLDDLRALSAKLRLEQNVELTGFVSDADLEANLAAADICVDPDPSSPLNDVSTWIKIMEYMAYGKPIVSFDLAETRYSAQDAALYVQPNNEGDFAKAITTLMDDATLRQKMGAAGRKRVENHLQWSVVGANLLAAYRRVFGGSTEYASQSAETESRSVSRAQL